METPLEMGITHIPKAAVQDPPRETALLRRAAAPDLPRTAAALLLMAAAQDPPRAAALHPKAAARPMVQTVLKAIPALSPKKRKKKSLNWWKYLPHSAAAIPAR